jgi:hypothetical protein
MNASSITNLEKYQVEYAAYILYKRHRPMSLLDIVQDIKEEFQVDFSEQELRNSIKKYDRDKDFTKENDMWTISAERIKKIETKLSNSINLKNYILEYKKSVDDSIEIDDIEKIIMRFIYYCFDTNKQNVMELLKGDKDNLKTYRIGDFESTTDEKQTINRFLNWDNKEKNQLLYDLISAGYTYGMITLKQDIGTSIFNSKILYLDTNVVVALSGIGSKSRSFALRQFHDKCIKNKIKLVTTSLTAIEVQELIKGKSNEIKNFIKESGGVVNPDILAPLNSGGMEDFYYEYYSWQKANDWRNFTAFEGYLNAKVNDILLLTNVEHIDIFEMKKHAKYNEYKNQLKELKEKKRGYYKNEAIDNDILNYIFVENKLVSSNTIWEQSHFIVSLDNTYKCWADGHRRLVPIIVHPSTWLSLLMRFNTRTDNDFEAFCKFLTLPLNDYQITDVTNILKEVKEITSDRDIQNYIISEIMKKHNSVDELSPMDLRVTSMTYYDKFIKEQEMIKDKEHEKQRQMDKERHDKEKKEAINADREASKSENIQKFKNDVEKLTIKKMDKFVFFDKNKKYIYSTFGLILTLLLLLLMINFGIIKYLNDFFESATQLESSILSYLIITLISGIIAPLALVGIHLAFVSYYKNYDFMYDKIYNKTYDKEFKKVGKYF